MPPMPAPISARLRRSLASLPVAAPSTAPARAPMLAPMVVLEVCCSPVYGFVVWQPASATAPATASTRGTLEFNMAASFLAKVEGAAIVDLARQRRCKPGEGAVQARFRDAILRA